MRPIFLPMRHEERPEGRAPVTQRGGGGQGGCSGRCGNGLRKEDSSNQVNKRLKGKGSAGVGIRRYGKGKRVPDKAGQITKDSAGHSNGI